MAVAAVDAFASGVVEVAELDGLLDELVLFGEPGGAHQEHHDPAGDDSQGDDGGDAGLGESVGLLWKELTHNSVAAAWSQRSEPGRVFGRASRTNGDENGSGLGAVGDAAGW